MKRIIYLLALLFISATVYCQKADYSGDWKLNKDKSELSAEFSMAPQKITILQEKNLLTETREVKFQEEVFTTTDKFTLDGKENENPGWMDSIKKSTANWSDDKSCLKIETKIPMQDGGDMTITSKYQLKEGMLVIHTKASSSYGEVSEVQVFTK